MNKYYMLSDGSSVLCSPVPVPGSYEITKTDYDLFIAALPEPVIIYE